jgi:hypothetical protein
LAEKANSLSDRLVHGLKSKLYGYKDIWNRKFNSRFHCFDYDFDEVASKFNKKQFTSQNFFKKIQTFIGKINYDSFVEKHVLVFDEFLLEVNFDRSFITRTYEYGQVKTFRVWDVISTEKRKEER